MKLNKFFFCLLIVAMSLIVSACGGSSSSSKNSAEVSVGVTASVFSYVYQAQPGYKVANAYFEVLSASTFSPSLINKIDISETITDGESTFFIDNLRSYKFYRFVVYGLDKNNVEICRGEKVVNLKPGKVTDLNLKCEFDKENTLLSAMADFIDYQYNDEEKTEEKTAVYLADEVEFGFENGYNHNQFVQKVIETVELKPAPIKKIKIVNSQTLIKERLITAKIQFEDGSVTYKTMKYISEDDMWKYAGNGWLYELSIAPKSVIFQPSNHTEEFYSGIGIYAFETKQPIEYIIAEGHSIPAGGIKLVKNNTNTFFLENLLHEPQYDKTLLTLSDADILLIPEDHETVYTFKAYDNLDFLLETRSMPLLSRPYLSTEVADNFFAKGLLPDLSSLITVDFETELTKPSTEEAVFMSVELMLKGNMEEKTFIKPLPLDVPEAEVEFETTSLTFDPIKADLKSKVIMKDTKEAVLIQELN